MGRSTLKQTREMRSFSTARHRSSVNSRSWPSRLSAVPTCGESDDDVQAGRVTSHCLKGKHYITSSAAEAGHGHKSLDSQKVPLHVRCEHSWSMRVTRCGLSTLWPAMSWRWAGDDLHREVQVRRYPVAYERVRLLGGSTRSKQLPQSCCRARKLSLLRSFFPMTRLGITLSIGRYTCREVYHKCRCQVLPDIAEMMKMFDRTQHLCLSDGDGSVPAEVQVRRAQGLQHHEEHRVAQCRVSPYHRDAGSGVVATECQRHPPIPRGAS